MAAWLDELSIYLESFSPFSLQSLPKGLHKAIIRSRLSSYKFFFSAFSVLYMERENVQNGGINHMFEVVMREILTCFVGMRSIITIFSPRNLFEKKREGKIF